jgi:integrase
VSSQLYAPIQAQYGASRVQKVHKTIQKALHDAVKLDLVARNVAELIEKSKSHYREMQVYTPAQAQQLLAAAKGDRLQASYALMLTTGCRWDELVGLRWEALDLERKELHVRYPTTEVGGLCLASTALQHPENAAVASLTGTSTGTSGESEDATGPSDQWLVLVQHAGPGPLVGRERLTHWRTLQRNAADDPRGKYGWASGLSPANGSAEAHPSRGAHTSGRR